MVMTTPYDRFVGRSKGGCTGGETLPYDPYVGHAHSSSLLMLKLSFLSLRGGQKRSARRGNLLVPPIEICSSIEILYREIATSLRSSQ